MKKEQTMRPVDAPMFHYWQALYRAFYSRRLYVDVAKRWRGFGLLYFLLLLVIVTLPFSVRMMVDFNRYIDDQLFFPVKQMPPLYIQNGTVLFDKPMPYLIRDKTGEVVIIIDTMDNATKTYKMYPHLTLLVTKDKLYFSPPKPQVFFNQSVERSNEPITVESFDKTTNEVFVGSDWIKTNHLFRFKSILGLMMYPMVILFFFGFLSILMLGLALLGQLFAQIFFKFKLSYRQASRLLMIASTPQVTLLFVLSALNATPVGMGLVYLVLLASYFNFAVFSVKRESNKLVLT